MKYLTRKHKIRKVRKSRKNRTRKIKGGLDVKHFLPILFASVITAFRPLNNRYTTISTPEVVSTTPENILSRVFEEDEIHELKKSLRESWPQEVTISTVEESGGRGGGIIPPSNMIKVGMFDPDEPTNHNKNQRTEVSMKEIADLLGIETKKFFTNYIKDSKKTDERNKLVIKLKEQMETL